MSTDLFRAQSSRMLAALALELGCELPAFSSHALTVVSRPSNARKGLIVQAIDTGMGTVLSVQPELVSWAKEHAPTDHHFRALQPFFLADLAQQARELGFTSARAHGFSLGFALAERLPVPWLPDRYTLREVDRAWMDRYRPLNVFANGLGEPDEVDRFEKTRTAFAVLAPDGEPAAVSAVWDVGHGREEIGVDVRRESRGMGLAKPVVIAATHAIVQAGNVPFYSCGATNVRSHRNALACGFLPLFTLGTVYSDPVPSPAS
ncbi:MAG: hypothetical protein ABI305_08270 [Tepidiformaceae bacterium]